MDQQHEVIVVGAGPAGATLAYEMASRNIDVLVIDKARFPRYKCCGGGITVKAARIIDIDISGIADNVITGADITLKSGLPFHGDSSAPLIYTVMRETFDAALVERAKSAGAKIMEEVEARSLQQCPGYVEVTTDAGNFRGTFVVGADGANSRVAKAIGVDNRKNSALCLTCRLHVSPEELAGWRAKIGIDLGRARGGYGWVFPKSDHLSVGIASPATKAKGLKDIFQEYLDSLGFERYEIAKWDAAVLPLVTGHPSLAGDRVILLGDAAGLADPLTGEGIFSAVLSAKLGAAAIEKALTQGQTALKDYSDTVVKTILADMQEALVFSRVLAYLPSRLLNVIKQDARVWNACRRLLRGETDYATIRKRVSSLGGLYNLISHMV